MHLTGQPTQFNVPKDDPPHTPEHFIMAAHPPPTIVHVRGSRPSPKQLAGELADAAVVLPLFFLTPFLRPWHRRWGATWDEVRAPMPGDDLVPGCQYVVTRAITVNAPPRSVWPWLVQVGFGRAGFYSNDLLDNVAHPSAHAILPDLQDLKIGDWIPMFSKVNDTTAFRVVELARPESMVWAKPDSSWAWRLTPVTGGTRLLTRLRSLYRWSIPAEAVFSVILNEFGDFPMMRKMLLTLKERAEADTMRKHTLSVSALVAARVFGRTPRSVGVDVANPISTDSDGCRSPGRSNTLRWRTYDDAPHGSGPDGFLLVRCRISRHSRRRHLPGGSPTRPFSDPRMQLQRIVGMYRAIDTPGSS
jgi:hypothetical protein